jgi:CheY-like chemotaxis protein
MLGAYGYSVLEADSGEEALRAVRDLQSPLDLVLSDIVMPGLSGPEIVAQLQEIQPGLQVIFMSGYTDDPVINRMISSEHTFLQKPITPHTLFRVIREKMDKAPPSP